MLPSYPFKILALLSDATLATKIREENWRLDKLFPEFKKAKSELKRLKRSIKASDLGRVHYVVNLLKKQIRKAFLDLKFINFYDSAILYLYFKSLRYLVELSKKEENRLMEKIKEITSEEASLSERKIEGLKKAKKKFEEKIKEYEKLINSFDEAKKALIKDYEHLVKELRKRRWDLEKQAQHEFAFIRFTLRSMKNINRKIKVEAIKVKKEIVPQENLILKRIKKGILESKDFVLMAKLISKAIDRISKDVYYSAKLISKFEKEMEKLKRDVEKLKNMVNNLIIKSKPQEEIAKMLESWDNAIKSLYEKVDKDLMQIFRNIFVLYKYVGTRELKAT